MKETNKTVGLPTERLPYEPPRTEVYTVELGSMLNTASYRSTGLRDATIIGTLGVQDVYTGGFEGQVDLSDGSNYVVFGDGDEVIDDGSSSGAKGIKWNLEW